MKSKINPDALYWATFNHFDLRIPGDAVEEIAQPGPNDAAVEYWVPKVRAQADADAFPNGPTPDKIRKELKEYGEWSSEELADDAANWNRIVWLGAHGIAEEDDPCCSEPVSPQPEGGAQ